MSNSSRQSFQSHRYSHLQTNVHTHTHTHTLHNSQYFLLVYALCSACALKGEEVTVELIITHANDKMSSDKMVIDKMTIDKMTIDKMTID